MDDNLVEEAENLQVSIVPVFNVATVLHRPNVTTITIQDEDSKQWSCVVSKSTVTVVLNSILIGD